jgi:hypothetical protein
MSQDITETNSNAAGVSNSAPRFEVNFDAPNMKVFMDEGHLLLIAIPEDALQVIGFATINKLLKNTEHEIPNPKAITKKYVLEPSVGYVSFGYEYLKRVFAFLSVIKPDSVTFLTGKDTPLLVKVTTKVNYEDREITILVAPRFKE